MKKTAKNIFELEVEHRKSLGEQVYATLQNAIIIGGLKPGQRLKEIEIASQMSISRTPLREALSRLEANGWLRKVRSGGYAVIDDTEKEVEDLFDVRLVLECHALKLALKNISDGEIKKMERVIENMELNTKRDDVAIIIELNTKFHETIFIASGNYKLCELLSHLHTHILRYRIKTLWNPEERRASLEGHKKIVKIIKERNESLADKIMSDHINHSKEVIMSRIKNQKKAGA
ncbi:MAG: GntR family transcriptional regulator [Spirochaetota bacterium]